MERDLVLLIAGAAISLFSSIVALALQHVLSLREDRIKRERDKQEDSKRQLVQAVNLQTTAAVSSDPAWDRFRARLQSRALEDAQAGNIAGATKKLRQAATLLLDLGEKELAEKVKSDAGQLEEMSVKCSNCGTVALQGTAYCDNCGAAIPNREESKERKQE